MDDNFRHTLTYNENPPLVLTKSPDGWENIDRTYVRDMTYHGIFPVESTPLRIYKSGVEDASGYQYILDAFDAEGIKATITYKRERLDGLTNTYETIFTGLMLLSPEGGFTHNITDRYVEVKAIDSSKLQAFLSNDEKEINLSAEVCIDGSATTPFASHPFDGTYPIIDLFVYALTTGQLGTTLEGEEFFTNRSENYDYIALTNDPNYLGAKIDATPGSTKVYTNTGDENIDVRIDIEGTIASEITYSPIAAPPNGGNVRQELYVELYNASHGIQEQHEYYLNLDNEFNITTDVTNTFSGTLELEPGGTNIYTVEPDWYIRVRNQITVFGLSGVEILVVSIATFTKLDVSEIYLSNPVRATKKTWYPNELSQRAMQIMTGEQDTSKLVDSSIFGRTDSEFQPKVVDGIASRLGTIGGSVFRLTNGVTKINFKDWFRSIDRMRSIALWYDKANDVVRIESKSAVYENTQILDLGTVSKLSIIPHKKSYFSQILSGTKEKGEYEKIQGVNEYNILSEHSADFPIKDKIDLRLPYNTDSLGAEMQFRTTFTDEALGDSKQDDKVYIYEFNDSDTVIVNSDIGTFDGFIDVTQYYNGNYTPRQNIEHQKNWLSAMFYKDADKVIRFKTNSKDVNITKDSIEEQSDIDMNPLDVSDPSFYIPELIKCESESIDVLGIINQLESNPNGYVKLNDESGNDYYGFIQKASIKEYKRTATWQLIRANDLYIT